MNTYGYVYGNSLKWTDPYGLAGSDELGPLVPINPDEIGQDPLEAFTGPPLETDLDAIRRDEEARKRAEFDAKVNEEKLEGNEKECKSDKRSGIQWILPGGLTPAEEDALLYVLYNIDNGIEPTGELARKWGSQYKNWSGDLPGASGNASPYLEYRVSPSSGENGPGPNRIVVNSETGETYYTWTHYGDAGAPAFVRIR